MESIQVLIIFGIIIVASIAITSMITIANDDDKSYFTNSQGYDNTDEYQVIGTLVDDNGHVNIDPQNNVRLNENYNVEIYKKNNDDVGYLPLIIFFVYGLFFLVGLLYLTSRDR